MERDKTTLNDNDQLWGYTDILESDLEQREFDKNFSSDFATFIEDGLGSLLNFPEEEQENLYTNESDEDQDEDLEVESEDDTHTDRDSYRDHDRDNVYYFI